MISTRLDFEKLNNTRDLGGMPAAGGRVIRPGMLFRSGQLGDASEADKKKLGEMLEVIVDFRSENEQNEKPDLKLPGVKNLPLPALAEPAPGVERDRRSTAAAFEETTRNPDAARGFMLRAYTDFVTSEYSRGQYRKFVDELLAPHEKGILWHCTAGKDRAGFGSVVAQALLGVPRDVIFEDYLFTNVCLTEECARITRMFNQRQGKDPDAENPALMYMLGAREEYLEATYRKIAEVYSDMDAYLAEGLGVTKVEREALIERYTM